LVYGGGSTASTTSVTNNGRWAAYPTITLNGPITNPTLGNTTQNKYLTFTGTYTNTDSLVIDLYNKLVTLNGVTARNLLTSGEWFWAPVGTSQFYMTGANTVPLTTTATVAWYNTYI
jgi:phage-related protein